MKQRLAMNLERDKLKKPYIRPHKGITSTCIFRIIKYFMVSLVHFCEINHKKNPSYGHGLLFRFFWITRYILNFIV